MFNYLFEIIESVYFIFWIFISNVELKKKRAKRKAKMLKKPKQEFRRTKVWRMRLNSILMMRIQWVASIKKFIK